LSGIIDVAVVGAGPAGLAAALAAGRLGCEVTLIDAGSGPGGQMYRPGMLLPGSGPPSRTAAEHLPPRLARIRQARQFRHLAATSVGLAVRGGDGVVTLWVGGQEGGAETTVEVRAVVLATGAAELVLPFSGWDLPGVTTAGAAAALLKGQGVTAGRRVLVGGSGPLLLPVAASLAEAGVRVVAVLEAGAAAATWEAEPPAVLAGRDVPVLTGHAVVACHGSGRVERAVIARLDPDWRPWPGSQREETVDAVHVSFGASPALELPRALGCAEVPHPARPTAAVSCDADLATSVPGVFAAGDVTGAGGAEVAELEGYLAGVSAARYLGRVDPAGYPAHTAELRGRLETARRRAARLDEAPPVRPGWLEWPDAGTIACRCEETPWSAVSAAAANGARNLDEVRQATGAGTGYCQARVCGPALQYAASVLCPGLAPRS
jgi:thioredoxin reductase